uniref:AAA+ ATPase domain-containing protein n=1 Tax=Mucochytrium quahogii TaxID=96639 RepID=A0A7S2RHQ3_9STRA|mmetsp:Transcript_40929/g.65771  ORF Transcript_40929/g.65771 Transcript_40929/m.65771 type:complete len:738 (+) Transcript_40929:814-3027(+)|eukprot:CAMPEP_0203761104 /NCGR_PEP_ID=MMETSP0098-20131031/14267_1 /ASSEMBLY_ACC=CAM_ASM_000208 /TAXON_ID=96639 /ORGANISM=" , Strain NY0313808BC1" /LENGTH=737 /DNA_ID=CAMNT_0050654957 /DNA_START=113 /DNA_END=2326 /DNA_ORIENTATION=-
MILNVVCASSAWPHAVAISDRNDAVALCPPGEAVLVRYGTAVVTCGRIVHDATLEPDQVGLDVDLIQHTGIEVGAAIEIMVWKSHVSDNENKAVCLGGGSAEQEDHLGIFQDCADFDVLNMEQHALDPSLEYLDLERAIARRLVQTCFVINASYIIKVLGQKIVLRGRQPSSSASCDNTRRRLIGWDTAINLSFAKATATGVKGKLLGNLDSAFEDIKVLVDANVKSLRNGQRKHLLIPQSAIVVAPHGCGKTTLFGHIEEVYKTPSNGVKVFYVECSRLVLEVASSVSFADFLPSPGVYLRVLLIDHLDVLASRAGKQEDENIQKAVDWLCGLLEESCNESSRMMVFGACTDESLDKLPNRILKASSPFSFQSRIEIGVPTEMDRVDILYGFLQEYGIDNGTSPSELHAEVIPYTAGFSGSDLRRLCRRILNSPTSEERSIIPRMVSAAQYIRPSQLAILDVSSRNISTTAGKWKGIGGYESVKRRLTELIHWQWNNKNATVRMGITAVSGIILHGPTGCGKTLFANCLASESKCNFVSVKASELLSMYLGESERLIRQLFARARKASPCILFLDELDALATKRNLEGGDNVDGVGNRVLATLLNEMDGVSDSQGVIVLAASNRYENIDAALLRPGRLGSAVFIPLPGTEDCINVLRTCCAEIPLDPAVDIELIAQRMVGASCAALQGLCTEAAMLAMREAIETDTPSTDVFVHARHFENAMLDQGAAVPLANKLD